MFFRLLKKIIFLLYLILFINVITPLIPKSYAMSFWKNSTQLPYQLASHTTFSYQTKIFTINGSANFMSSKHSVLSNNSNQNGSLGSWEDELTNTPEALIWHVSASNNNYIYILGGKEENQGSSQSHVNKVYKSSINNGSISPWTATTNLPQAISLGYAFIRNNKIYYLGGMRELGGNIYSQKIYAADINSIDGSLGGWIDVGNLPVPLSGFGLFIQDDHIIIAGGENSNGKSNKTYTTTFQTDGTINIWTETSNLPVALTRAQFTKYNSTIFTIGGIKSDGSASDQVYFTQIKSDGTLEPWQASLNTLPQPTCCGSALLSNNFIYLMGGHNTFTGEYYDDVFYTSPDEIIGSGNIQILNVPYFSQNSSPWGEKEYDHAKSLKFPNTKFERWGCAVTSVAMIMKYHNINKMPNGTPLDPGSLNNWLKDNKGYLTGKDKDGSYSYLSFPSISTLSKKIYDEDKSRYKLEYYREKPTSANLDTFLSINKHPVILKVSNDSTNSHFIVAKGKTNGIYDINDPEWNYNSLSSFNNSFSQLDRFVPAKSNLSYIVIVTNPKTHLLITDPQGKKTGSVYINGEILNYNEIPNATYSYQEPISNPNSLNINELLGTGVNEFLLPKPDNGSYLITVSSLENRHYEMNISTFQENGLNNLNLIKSTTDKKEKFIMEFNQRKSAKIKKSKSCENNHNHSSSNTSSNTNKYDHDDKHDQDQENCED